MKTRGDAPVEGLRGALDGRGHLRLRLRQAVLGEVGDVVAHHLVDLQPDQAAQDRLDLMGVGRRGAVPGPAGRHAIRPNRR